MMLGSASCRFRSRFSISSGSRSRHGGLTAFLLKHRRPRGRHLLSVTFTSGNCVCSRNRRSGHKAFPLKKCRTRSRHLLLVLLGSEGYKKGILKLPLKVLPRSLLFLRAELNCARRLEYRLRLGSG